ncbi:His Kinase A (phospho-acceptor) domain-containing protein [Allopseudospirillum japonicum]|uniref:histidine kinase n=1 Tax=Allopseudospirillum japonicum TaxID=64971 RepID=A0A1H6SWY3_9GAMM|nr:response regulator [Allopseudospirillum japonicum]SEI72393.1 His Kinase A (phospho-acceptor) domain-containing protein [Allopseudospirillum japonicum]
MDEDQQSAPPLTLWWWKLQQRFVLLPLFAIAIIFGIGFAAYTLLEARASQQVLIASTEKHLLEFVQQQARGLNIRLDAIARRGQLFASQTQRALIHPAPNPTDAELQVTDEGVLHKAFNDGGAALFFSALYPRDPQKDRLTAARLLSLQSLMTDLYRTESLIQQVYINTARTEHVIYPFIQVLKQYPPHTDVRDHAFFYSADEEHNPRRTPVWTPVYLDPAGRGWMLSNVAPVYLGNTLTAVVGMDITVQAFVSQLQQIELPWDGAYAMLLDAEGMVLAMPPQAEQDWGVKELTEHTYPKTPSSQLGNQFKPETFNLFQRPDFASLTLPMRQDPSGLLHVDLQQTSVVAWASVTETNWKFMLVVPEPTLYLETYTLSHEHQRILVAVAGVSISLWLILIILMWQRTKRTAYLFTEALASLYLTHNKLSKNHQSTPDDKGKLPQIKTNPFSLDIEALTNTQEFIQLQKVLNRACSAQGVCFNEYHQQEFYIWCQRLCELWFQRSHQPCVLITSTHEVLYFNHAWENHLGLGIQQPKTKEKIYELFRQQALPLYPETRLLQVTRDQSQGTNFLLYLVPLHMQPQIEDKTQEAALFLGICLDMSSIVEKQTRLSVNSQRVREASQIKSGFIAAVSNEARAPLNTVIGLAELLKEAGETQEHPFNAQHLGFIDAILESSNQLLAIIEDVGQLSDLEQGTTSIKPIPFQPESLVQDVLAQFESQAQAKALQIKADIDTRIPQYLLADEYRLKQVLNHLMSNAIKFTRQGHVHLNVDLIEGPAHPKANHNNQLWLRFAVSDTGVGIHALDTNHLFRPFSQLEMGYGREHGGAGIGLTLSKHLIEQMGGDIQVKSRIGQGSVFSVCLPCQPIEASQTQVQDAHILVVDDGPVNTMLARAILEKSGYQVSVVHDGYQALHCAKHTDFDLVLMDIFMPEIDGIETTRRWRASLHGHNRRIPIIALTANALEQDRDTFFAAGMNDYLGKPYRPTQLRQMVAKWLAYLHTESLSCSSMDP